MTRRNLSFFFALIALFASACGSATSVEVGGPGDDPTVGETTTTTSPPVDADIDVRLQAAQERWNTADITSYVVAWSPTCFCPAVTFTDTVVDGAVDSHKADETFFEMDGMTIDDMFAEIQLALDDEPFHIEAEFDEETGAVISYWVDVDERMADEEHGIVVHSVTPGDGTVPELPGGPVLTAADFTVDHGCGHGFATGSDDQTLGLVLIYTGDWTEEGPILAEPIDLATNKDWNARISVGADLFSNWCDDVIEEHEPTPRTDREFTISQGILTSDVNGYVASGVISGLVAEPVDGIGETIEIAEVQLRNDLWGFYAG